MKYRKIVVHGSLFTVLAWAAVGFAQQETGTPSLEDLLLQVPDPELDREIGIKKLEEFRAKGDKNEVKRLESIFEMSDSVRRPNQLRLTLEEAIRRALANSYAIEIQSFNPAIETTRVVEAEAVFDAIFFTDIRNEKIDQPSGSQLTANTSDRFSSTYGVRKLLPTGAEVTGSYSLVRFKTSLSFQQLNPAYTSTLALEIRQPLLRGFGLDYNRYFINIRKNNKDISDLAFQRQIEDTLSQVEQAYWRLVSARRDIVITARLQADFETIYRYIQSRQTFDATPVQLNTTLANLEGSRFEFIQKKAEVFNAEDRLILVMNDPTINLADDIEIIPETFPPLTRIEVDRLAEVQIALDHRPEIRERRLDVKNAEISVGRAKNDELPRLDLSVTSSMQGLAGTADRSFDEVSRHRFISYVIGVSFEVPIGNRGPRAAHHRARLELAQAKAAQKLEMENTILEVNEAVRLIATRYDQIMPTFKTAQAREREVDSIIARAERKDYNTLTNELNARRSLAGARRILIQAIVQYNIAIISLEQAKGTLLGYDNVILKTAGE
ncbi:MAG: TolC family protein [Planctomycetes bacterium]|nr:TolC family protein [Planctomycetota bacterium]